MLGLINQSMEHMPQVAKPMWLAKPGIKCASLDGVNDYINCGDFSGDLDGGDGFTLGLWIKIPDKLATNFTSGSPCIHLGDGITNEYMFAMGGTTSSGGTMTVTYNNVSKAPISSGSSTLRNNYRYMDGASSAQWHRPDRNINRWVPIIFGWDKDEATGAPRIKVGVGEFTVGVSETDALPTLSGSTALQSMYIGCYFSTIGILSYDRFKIAEVALWNGKLAEADMLLFQAGIAATDIPNPLSGLIHYWKFNNDVEDYGSATDSDAVAVNGADTNAGVLD